jgi:hypothetical protein
MTDEPKSDAQPDVVKDKFRQALERKRTGQAAREAGDAGGDTTKIHGEHGAAGGKRTFRRKSGG